MSTHKIIQTITPLIPHLQIFCLGISIMYNVRQQIHHDELIHWKYKLTRETNAVYNKISVLEKFLHENMNATRKLVPETNTFCDTFCMLEKFLYNKTTVINSDNKIDNERIHPDDLKIAQDYSNDIIKALNNIEKY